jgi:hypothetical protein
MSAAQDPLTQAIEKNPCGICRAKRLPTCICKRGGGGSSEEESAEKNDALPTTPHTPTLAHLNHIFSESPVWQPVPDADDSYTYNDPQGLFSIKLDLGAGSLELTKRPDLSKEELQQLEKLLNMIENAFLSFKSELEAKGIDTQAFQCEHKNGSLIIKIPNPTYFDAFIQRLVDKQLLPTNTINKTHSSASDDSTSQEDSLNQENNTTAPNPFDISKGPDFGE